MNPHDSAFAYRQSTAVGASPVGQVVALYDTILRDFRRAIAALGRGQIEQRVEAVNHALIVIGELQGVLDFEQGGEPARNLDNFYKVARGMITQASIAGSVERFQELVTMFTRIRAAWSQIEHIIPYSSTTEHLRISSETQGSFSKANPPTENSSDSGGGGWSA